MLRPLLALAVTALLAGCIGKGACVASAADVQVSGLSTDPRLVAPADVTFDVEQGEGVRDDEVATILGGIAMAKDAIAALDAPAMSADAERGMVVRVVATGKGLEEYGGACCVGGWAPPGERYGPFFDVGQMRGPPTGAWPTAIELQKVAAHEFTHYWQGATQCQTERATLTPWMAEGMAEFVAYEGLVAGGWATREQVHAFMTMAAVNTGAIEAPLAKLGTPEAPHHPGHVGYLAFHALAAEASPAAVLDLCERLSGGATLDEAFESAFGRSLAGFHEAWDARATPKTC